MSNFTVTPPVEATLITLEEGLKGQVDIILHDADGHAYRVLAIGDGKLHLPRFNTEAAKQMGLKLDADHRPVITHM